GMRRLMEEHLYWVAFYFRWTDDGSWKIVKETFFKDLPMPMKLFVPTLVRRSAMRDLYGQGVGRHSTEEVFALGCENIKAISDFLSDQPYLMGDEPTSLDATGYGMLSNIMQVSIDSRLKSYALGFENLVAYCDRMHTRYWSNAPIPSAVEV
ncbi:MAG: glutathione S-transferase C-terminal domain-containing protein, partial [Cyanobacteria bacterium P01_A01_bin.17]